MKASLLYRIAAGILVLFFLGHTFGFRGTNPPFGVDAVVAAMQSVHFDLQGSSRTYWDLYSGLGFSTPRISCSSLCWPGSSAACPPRRWHRCA